MDEKKHWPTNNAYFHIYRKPTKSAQPNSLQSDPDQGDSIEGALEDPTS